MMYVFQFNFSSYASYWGIMYQRRHEGRLEGGWYMKVMIMRVGSAGILLLAFRNQRYGKEGLEGVTYTTRKSPPLLVTLLLISHPPLMSFVGIQGDHQISTPSAHIFE